MITITTSTAMSIMSEYESIGQMKYALLYLNTQYDTQYCKRLVGHYFEHIQFTW